eukprot:TRINITY_DN1244_c0_g1_i1.p1 TRINITY_DN1244_c0_g1~~TRINITY_DN1244_c0_g1_i1.p1  ORF type:complete len:594 (+),score=153.12 TRINITY_DN1244_c0_g1_i1:137-1783(+)
MKLRLRNIFLTLLIASEALFFVQLSIPKLQPQVEFEFTSTPSPGSVARSVLSYEHVLGRSCSRKTERTSCEETYVCDDGECSKCTSDDQCHRLSSQAICNSDGECRHKPLFYKFSFSDATVITLFIVGSMLSSAGGLGGGGLYVPILILVGGFSAFEAIPLSKATALGTAIANYVVFSLMKRPDRPNFPIIDYSAASILEPAVLLGAMIGVYLNMVSPDWLVVILLGVILSYTSVRSFQKGVKVWKDESQKRKMVHKGEPRLVEGIHGDDEGHHDKEQEMITYSSNGQDGSSEGTGDGKKDDEAFAARLAKVDQRESRTFPWDFLGLLVIAWVGIFLIALFRGSKSRSSMVGIEMCSVEYWLLVLTSIPLLGGVTETVRRILQRQHEEKTEIGYKFADGEIHWTKRNAFLYPFLCIFAGITTSLLGIGGGMILSPMMFALGMTPQVTAATSGFTILFTESSIGIQFLLLGLMPLDYGALFLLIGYVSALVGRLVLGQIIKKYNRSSIIIFILAIVIGVSAILMAIVGILRVKGRVEANDSMGFRPLCD